MLASVVVDIPAVAQEVVNTVNTERQTQPKASAAKENPIQDILANGQKAFRAGMKGITRQKSSKELNKGRDAKETKEVKTPKSASPRLRRLRAITLSASAPQLFHPKPVTRERSNSVPFQPDLISKSLDAIWDDVEEKWNEIYSQPGKLTALLYKKGIPNTRREVLWTKISKLIPNTELLKCSHEEVEGHRCIYKRLLDMKDTSHEHQIKADITRTFPNEEAIYAPEFQQSLFNVLKAFSLYDGNVGYCQGLSFVAALLLMHVKEEQAFFMLIRILKGHNLRSFYTEDMRGVKLRMYQINKLSEFLFPEMHRHMENLGVSIGVITTPWLMTAFGYQLSLDVAMRVADVMLLEGIPALFRIALAILVLCEKEIMELSVDQVMDYFRSDLKTKFQDPQQLMNTAYAVNISMSQLENLEYEFLQTESSDASVDSEFSHKSAEDIEELENTLRYSQVLVGSHELSETLLQKTNECDDMRKQFDQFRKKAESEKIALIEKMGRLLDKLSVADTLNEELDEKLAIAQENATHYQAKYNQMSDCCHTLAQELHKFKQKGKP